MPSHWNNRSPPHSVHIEHRLTVVEVEAQQAKAEARSAKAVTLQHGRRITALEGQQSKRPAWTPRDWLLSAAWIGFASHYRKQGAERVEARIEKKVEANAQKADKVRNAVQSAPASSLRDSYTRD